MAERWPDGCVWRHEAADRDRPTTYQRASREEDGTGQVVERLELASHMSMASDILMSCSEQIQLARCMCNLLTAPGGRSMAVTRTHRANLKRRSPGSSTHW